jgi:hypothetical protein
MIRVVPQRMGNGDRQVAENGGFRATAQGTPEIASGWQPGRTAAVTWLLRKDGASSWPEDKRTRVGNLSPPGARGTQRQRWPAKSVSAPSAMVLYT